MLMKKISKKQKDCVIALYQGTDLPNYTIAKICGVATGTMYKILEERNVIPKRLTEISVDEVDKAVAMYESGCKVSDILEHCNVSQPRLYAEIDARGIERRNCRYTQIRGTRVHPKRKQILKEYQKGHSYSEIERKLGVSDMTVRKYVEQAIEAGEIKISKRYETQEAEYLQDVASVIVRSTQEVSIREVAKALKVDEKKLYYRVTRAKNK